MFMTTTLAHYQLPVSQVALVGPSGEAAGSGRVSLDRPVAVMTPKTELPASQIIAKPQKSTLPFEFHQWLERLQGYEKGAEQHKAARSAAEAIARNAAHAEAEAQAAPVAAEAGPATEGAQAKVASAEAAPAEERPVAAGPREGVAAQG